MNNRKIVFFLLIIILGSSVGCHDDAAVTQETNTKRLEFYTDTFFVQDQGFQPPVKTKFEYDNSGRLIKQRVFTQNPDGNVLEESHYFDFIYDGNRVKEINRFEIGAVNPGIQYEYEYNGDESVSKITENNHNAGVITQAQFTYDNNRTLSKVIYSNSNGFGFAYEMVQTNSNIIEDKTFNGSELCNEGVYEYDQKINPFSTLGYVDFTLNNISVNNKILEDVSYLNCSFPSLAPVSHDYTYDADGYPQVVITHFANTSKMRQRLYFYK